MRGQVDSEGIDLSTGGHKYELRKQVNFLYPTSTTTTCQ